MRLSTAGRCACSPAIYTELFKNIPLLAIIFLTYFGLRRQGVRLSVFEAGALSLVIFYAAYLSEIFRSAIGRRARRSAGGRRGARPEPPARRSRRSIFPQALRSALPGTNTMLVDLLKSTSLLVTISAAELMSEGQLIASETFRALEVYVVIAAIYFALCYPLSQGLLWFERQIRGGRPAGPWRRRRLREARVCSRQERRHDGRSEDGGTEPSRSRRRDRRRPRVGASTGWSSPSRAGEVLKGVSLEVAAQQDREHHRPERRWQDDAAALREPARAA